MKDLPFIEDKALYKGVDLALWLYLDKHWSFKSAVLAVGFKKLNCNLVIICFGVYVALINQ